MVKRVDRRLWWLILGGGTAAVAAPIPVPGVVGPVHSPTFEADAAAWARRLLTPEYRPPAGSRFALLPMVDGKSLDLMRMEYRVDGRTVVLTQTVSTFVLQFVELSAGNTAIPSAGEMQSLGRRAFVGAAPLKFTAIAKKPTWATGMGDPESVPKAPWLHRLFWATREGQVNFYFLKSMNPAADNRTFDRFWNRRWFTLGPPDEGFERDPIVNEVFRSPGAGDAFALNRAAGAAARLLQPEARPPASLLFQPITQEGMVPGKAARIRYNRGEYVVTLTLAGNEFFLMAERLKPPAGKYVWGPGNQLVFEAKNEITPAQVEAFVRQTLLGGEKLSVVTEVPPKNENASGTFRPAAETVTPAAVPQNVRWWTRRGALILSGTL